MPVDDLVTQDTIATGGMVLTQFLRIFHAAHEKG